MSRAYRLLGFVAGVGFLLLYCGAVIAPSRPCEELGVVGGLLIAVAAIVAGAVWTWTGRLPGGDS